MNVLGLVKFHALQSMRHLRYLLRLLRRPAVIRIHGVLLPIPQDASEAYRRSLYLERHERSLARMIIATLTPQDRVLEMGSGRGMLSTLSAKRIGSERVFTCEANPALIPFIERVYALNGVRPTLMHAAVGTAEAEVRFHVCEKTASSSLLPHGAPGEAVLVRQRDVNRLLADIRPTFLVVDIEGAEKEVLGAADLTGIRVIALEIHPARLGATGFADLDAAIRSQGFRMNRWLSTGGRRLYERPP